MLTAKALRSAYRYERLMRRQREQSEAEHRADLERVALIGFQSRLLDALAKRHGVAQEERLAEASGEELDRLVDIAMAVLAEEGKGR